MRRVGGVGGGRQQRGVHGGHGDAVQAHDAVGVAQAAALHHTGTVDTRNPRVGRVFRKEGVHEV